MRPGLRPASPFARASSWLAVPLLAVALAGDPAAAVPRLTYASREFVTSFLPARLFAAGELRAGRLGLWNPFLREGVPQAPALYPADLLLAAWPSPVFASWLLTLHLPLAALAAFALARGLGASPAGAFVSGATYALGGLAVSCLDRAAPLPALALAPLVVLLLRGAALHGSRAVLGAAFLLAVALTTLAASIVLPAILLGIALALAAAPIAAGLRRVAASLALGAGLAGVPLALALSARRAGGVASGLEPGADLHPVALLGVLLPGLFGSPAIPPESWWGADLVGGAVPAIATLHLGPIALALAALGAGALPPRVRGALLGMGALGILAACASHLGLAPIADRLPGGGRWDGALVLPYLAVAVCAGRGMDSLRSRASGWTPLVGWLGGTAGIAVLAAALLKAEPSWLVSASGVAPAAWPLASGAARNGTALVLASAALAAALAWGVRRGLLTPGRAAVALSVLLVADLARGGRGIGRQVHPSFLERLPEVAALPLLDADGGRLFSLGPDHSPSFRAFLSRGGEDLALTDTFVRRQVLTPATNVVDRLESPDGGPGLVSGGSDLDPALRQPGEISRLLPWLRNAGVSRLLSLDPLDDPGLVPLGAVAPGPPGLAIHAYAVDAPWPRVAVACRVVAEPDPGRALRAPGEPGFDPRRDVVLSPEAAPSGCRRGRARLTHGAPTEERYDVEADGDGYLVVRASAAPGWRALVDGEEETVRLANGKHRAVRVGPGRHEVVMRYAPPGLELGLAATGLALLAAAVAWIVTARPRPDRRR